MRRFVIALFVILNLAQPAWAAKDVQNNSGLPLPRFTCLKTAEVNVRTGPGARYPIQFVYRRETMPVEVIEEYDLWRKIRDIEGTTGWVHKQMLDGKRYALIRGKEPVVLRFEPDGKSKPLLKAEPMVIARVVECEKEWCRLQLTGRKGWVQKTSLWGIYDKEVFD